MQNHEALSKGNTMQVPKETILMLGLSEVLRTSSGHEGVFVLPPQILIN